jgi:hypothetical protein
MSEPPLGFRTKAGVNRHINRLRNGLSSSNHYAYFCDDCRLWHVGLDGGAAYHLTRTSCAPRT